VVIVANVKAVVTGIVIVDVEMNQEEQF